MEFDLEMVSNQRILINICSRRVYVGYVMKTYVSNKIATIGNTVLSCRCSLKR